MRDHTKFLLWVERELDSGSPLDALGLHYATRSLQLGLMPPRAITELLWRAKRQKLLPKAAFFFASNLATFTGSNPAKARR